MTSQQSTSESERAYEWLRTEILHGDLMPGDRLRPAALREKRPFGLTPIREALMRLSSEGLIDSESHRGVRVRQASPAEFADLMSTRREIEQMCLTRAMANGGAEWEAEIVSAMHVLERTPLPTSRDDRAAAVHWEVNHRRLHAALVSACRSAWLLRFWNTLADQSERYRKVRLLARSETTVEPRDINAEHSCIVDAVLARDTDQAVHLMNQHLTATECAILGLLPGQGSLLDWPRRAS